MHFVKAFQKAAGILKTTGPKILSKPMRVTPSTQPLDAVKGLSGLTGAKAMKAPFSSGNAVGHFGKTPRKGLVSRTAVATGRTP